jgi:hypothetical protein
MKHIQQIYHNTCNLHLEECGMCFHIPVTYQLVKTTAIINKLRPVRKERLEIRVQITSKNLQKYSHINVTAVATACPHTDKHME